MIEILTAAQMREIEAAAIESGTVTGLELMERAGRGAVETIFTEWPELDDGARQAVVLCGPGNNGGDGFVVARLLAERGWDVTAIEVLETECASRDARVNRQNWLDAGGVIRDGFDFIYGEDDGRARLRLLEADLVIDAVFGIGLSRPLGNLHAEIWQAFAMDSGGPVRGRVAIDIPSGLCADSGRALGLDMDDVRMDGLPIHAFQANLTVTFHAAKLGHYLAHGPEMCGKIVIVDIGLSRRARRDSSRPCLAARPMTERLSKRSAHKYTHGHAVILSGGVGKGGAARMAARAALRVGAGVVTLGCPPAALIENAAQLNAIMLRSVRDGDALRSVLEDPRISALCLGPGMGTGEREAGLLRAALTPDRIPCSDCHGVPDRRGPGAGLVLDADALTLLSRHEDLRALVHDRCVLTPHAGEFARVFPDIAEKQDAPTTTGPAYSRIDAARSAATRIGATVLLKGPATVIATPDGRTAINAAVYDRATPWLATAGAGDVIAGLITGLQARGFSPFDAACSAAWLHTEAARKFGPGLIAEDLPGLIPDVLADLGA